MIQVPKNLLQQCYGHGGRTYPEEACGVLSGPKDDPGLLTAFHAMENTLDRLHAEDPKRYPRTPREGYVLDPAAFMKLDKELAREGQQIRVIYHTHVDVGAYFSEEDVKQATWAGEPIWPGMVYLVCGIKKQNPDGAILAAFNADSKAFDQQPVP